MATQMEISKQSFFIRPLFDQNKSTFSCNDRTFWIIAQPCSGHPNIYSRVLDSILDHPVPAFSPSRSKKHLLAPAVVYTKLKQYKLLAINWLDDIIPAIIIRSKT